MSLLFENIKFNIIPTYREFLRKELGTGVYFSDEDVDDINFFVRNFLKINNISFSNEVDVNLFHTIFETMEKIIFKYIK
jgi:hypothetical protein